MSADRLMSARIDGDRDRQTRIARLIVRGKPVFAQRQLAVEAEEEAQRTASARGAYTKEASRC